VNVIGSGSGGALSDKLDEDCLNLSLIRLEEVPVNEMAVLTKGTSIGLFNNLLVLPVSFA